MAVIIVMVPACGRSPGRATGQDAAVAALPSSVTVSLDGRAAATFTAADLATRRRVADAFSDDVRDPARWSVLHGVAAPGPASEARELMVPDFGHHYPAHDVYLYLDGGRPTVGVFRRPRADQPAHVQRALATAELSLVGVATLAIWTDASDSPDRGGPATPATGLTVVVDGRAVDLAADRLGAIAPREAVGPEPRKRSGWPLADVLALAGLGAAPPRALVATGDSDETVRLDAAALADPGHHAIIRRDRHGALRLAVWHDRDPAYVAQVHHLSRIEVTMGGR